MKEAQTIVIADNEVEADGKEIDPRDRDANHIKREQDVVERASILFARISGQNFHNEELDDNLRQRVQSVATKQP